MPWRVGRAGFRGSIFAFALPFSFTFAAVFACTFTFEECANSLREVDIVVEGRGCEMSWRGTTARDRFSGQTWSYIKGLSRDRAKRGPVRAGRRWAGGGRRGMGEAECCRLYSS